MKENVSTNWARKRERLLVARVLEAGLDFNSSEVRKIIYEMSYENQKLKNPQDCPCYSSQPCHDGVDNFNCFVCGCPNYNSDLNDEIGFTGGCNVRNGRGKYAQNPNPGKDGLGEKIWDCSECSFYHTSLSSEIYLIMNLKHYSALAEILKKEKVEGGFADFKSFADYLSGEVMG